MPYQFELALRQYIAAFGGTKNISPEEFKSRFDNVYHKDYTFRPKDGKTMENDGLTAVKSKEPLTREEMYEHDSRLFEEGVEITLIHLRKIGLDCVDLKIGLTNGEEESTIRVVTTISGKQAVMSREIDESPESNLFFQKKLVQAKCESMFTSGKSLASSRQICNFEYSCS